MEELKRIKERVDELRKRLEAVEGKSISQGEICRRYMPFSETTWVRLMSGTYAGNVERKMDEAQQAVDDMEARVAVIEGRASRCTAFVRTRIASAVLGAFGRARDDQNGCRLVVLLAPTGAGKTTIGRYMENRYGAVYVEGSQSWRTSYTAFCADVSAAAGSPIHAKRVNGAVSESTMLAALGKKSGALYIDEANTLGKGTANAIKLIANKTEYSLVIAAIPEAWDDFCAQATSEVKQVLNRTQAVIRFDSVTPAEAAQFLPACAPKELCNRVAVAANAFGAYKTLKRVADALSEGEREDATEIATKTLARIGLS